MKYVILCLLLMQTQCRSDDMIYQRLNYGTVYSKVVILDTAAKFWRHTVALQLPTVHTSVLDWKKCTEDEKLCEYRQQVINILKEMRVQSREHIAHCMDDITMSDTWLLM
jgi:hypothetical protein